MSPNRAHHHGRLRVSLNWFNALLALWIAGVVVFAFYQSAKILKSGEYVVPTVLVMVLVSGFGGFAFALISRVVTPTIRLPQIKTTPLLLRQFASCFLLAAFPAYLLFLEIRMPTTRTLADWMLGGFVVFGVCIAPGLLVSLADLGMRLRTHPNESRCLGCGYDLRGLRPETKVCPECGTERDV